jgi:hypothetical protein
MFSAESLLSVLIASPFTAGRIGSAAIAAHHFSTKLFLPDTHLSPFAGSLSSAPVYRRR